jgi:branched-chain amino acid transport system permease protein
VGLSVLRSGASFVVAMLVAGLAVGCLGAVDRARRVAAPGAQPAVAGAGHAGHRLRDRGFLPLVLGGDPQQVSPPAALQGAVRVFGLAFPLYRLAVLLFAIAVAVALWLLLEKTRIGMMIRASVDDMQMARSVGIPAPWLYVLVFLAGHRAGRHRRRRRRGPSSRSTPAWRPTRCRSRWWW